tara:strand:- start:956 stop:1210 length:255 start_codon:yes stop_codon:yes gene_type:complete
MSINYKELNQTIYNSLSKIIDSHDINLLELLQESIENSTYSESTIITKNYNPINKKRELKINNKNYQKLLINNIILIDEILKRI